MKNIHSFFLKNVSYPFLVKPIYNQNFWSIVKDFEKLQFESRNALTERAENKIRKLVAHAHQNVAFYRNKFDELSISPDDIQKISDLQKLPIVTKRDLKINFPQNVVARNIPEERRILSSTSGSTGEPFQFYLDKNSLDIRTAARIFFNRWAGIEPGVQRVWVHGHLPMYQQDKPNKRRLNPFKIAKSVMRKVLLTNEHTSHISVFDIEKNNMLNILWHLNKVNPDYIETYSSAIVELANGSKDCNLKASPKLKAIIATSDTLLPTQQQLIEEQFNCSVVNRYGGREFTGSVAQVCPENNDLFHVNTESVFLEVVTEEGEQVAPGERGKIVITDLNNYVMPFIRYDMGDMAVLGHECPCGRGFITLEKIEGRSAELLRLPNGKSISEPMLTSLLRVRLNNYITYIRSYQAIQHTGNEVEFKVIPEDKFNENVKIKLKDALSELLGDDINVNITLTDKIQREASGKRLLIKSKC